MSGQCYCMFYRRQLYLLIIRAPPSSLDSNEVLDPNLLGHLEDFLIFCVTAWFQTLRPQFRWKSPHWSTAGVNRVAELNLHSWKFTSRVLPLNRHVDSEPFAVTRHPAVARNTNGLINCGNRWNDLVPKVHCVAWWEGASMWFVLIMQVYCWMTGRIHIIM